MHTKYKRFYSENFFVERFLQESASSVAGHKGEKLE